MKYSLLDMTQTILSAMDSDEVNSISDTSEARQVAEVIRTAYFNIISRLNLPEHNTSFQLDSSGEDTQPVLMLRPSNVVKIEWIKYNVFDEDDSGQRNYRYVTILPVMQFKDFVGSLSIQDPNVNTLTLDNQKFYFKNDKQPEFCTILKDRFIVFDSFNESIESTLQTSKTECWGRVVPIFEMTNEFVPDLDDDQFPLLLNEAKCLAFYELKQVDHALAQREARRQWIHSQKGKHLHYANDRDQFLNFGRK